MGSYAIKQERRISKAQIKAVKTLANQVYHTNEDYKEALDSYGVDTCVNLSSSQASQFISKMSQSINQKEKVKKTYFGAGSRGLQRHLTPEQAERIGILEELLGWNNIRTVNFIKRQTGKNKAVNMLANYEAVKVIVGMQRIASGGDKELYAKINKMNNAQLNEAENGLTA